MCLSNLTFKKKVTYELIDFKGKCLSRKNTWLEVLIDLHKMTTIKNQRFLICKFIFMFFVHTLKIFLVLVGLGYKVHFFDQFTVQFSGV
jgi:hypothetical protein